MAQVISPTIQPTPKNVFSMRMNRIYLLTIGGIAGILPLTGCKNDQDDHAPDKHSDVAVFSPMQEQSDRTTLGTRDSDHRSFRHCPNWKALAISLKSRQRVPGES